MGSNPIVSATFSSIPYGIRLLSAPPDAFIRTGTPTGTPEMRDVVRSTIPHLLCREGIYYFRARVPKSRQTAFGGLSEVKLSLKTANLGCARRLCRRLSNAFEIFFRHDMAMPYLSVPEINGYIRRYFQDQLNEALAESTELPGLTAFDLDAELASLQQELPGLRQRLGRMQFDKHEKREAERLVNSLKPSASELDVDGWRMAYAGVLRAKIAARQYLIAAFQGDPAGMTPSDPLFQGMMPNAIPELDAQPVSKPGGVTTHDAIRLYIEKQVKSGVADKTLADFKRALGWFGELVGTLRLIAALSSQDIKDFRDGLERVPAKLGGCPEFFGKSFPDIVKVKHDRPLISTATQNKYFIMLRTFLNWCEAEELIDKVPGANVKVVSQGKHKSGEIEVRPYSTEQLQTIFSSPAFQGCKSPNRRAVPGPVRIKDANYWIPIVGHFTGMRLGEIVQLLATDVRQQNEVLYFDVNTLDDSDKKLKTQSSRRKVPLPQKLLDLGFQEFVDQKRSNNTTRLFDEIECGADGYYSSTFSKWWTRYTRSVGAYHEQTRFHSFRHGFKDALMAAEVPEVFAKALMGHSDNSVHASYGMGPSLEKLQEAVNRAAFSMDLVSLLKAS